MVSVLCLRALEGKTIASVLVGSDVDAPFGIDRVELIDTEGGRWSISPIAQLEGERVTRLELNVGIPRHAEPAAPEAA
jgi:hypothetical protein